MKPVRSVDGTAQSTPKARGQREDGRRIRGAQCPDRRPARARTGNVRNDQPRRHHNNIISGRQDDRIAGFAEPARHEPPNQVVGFDNDDAAFRFHKVPKGARAHHARHEGWSDSHSIRVAARQYARARPADDKRHNWLRG